MNLNRKSTIIIMLAFIFSGCGMGFFSPIRAYEGSALPDSQTALLSAKALSIGNSLGDGYASVNDILIDGKSYTSLLSGSDQRNKSYAILPGKKNIVVHYERGENFCINLPTGNPYNPIAESCSQRNKVFLKCSITFEAKPTQEYEVSVTTDYSSNVNGKSPTSVRVSLKSSPDQKLATGKCM
jgi:hypothetical protein